MRIRQSHRADRELLLHDFQRLSPESRYRRFLAPMPRLPEATVRHLTEIDHQDHEAMIALGEKGTEALGVARYARDPVRPGAAEVAVTVVDDWQGSGLGTRLLEATSARARGGHPHVHRVNAGLQSGDGGPVPAPRAGVQVLDREAGTVEIEVAIPTAGVARELRELLGLAAKHDVAVPVTRRAARRTTL